MADYRRRRRRMHSRRRRMEARGGSLLPILLFVILTPIAIVVAITVFFKVSSITVTGESGYSEVDIIKASGIETGKNMFAFNKFKSIKGIFNKMPYIDEISIRRHLPDHVEIIVTRCTPVAAIEGEDGWYLIDINGKVLENVGVNPPDDYPSVTGVRISDTIVGKYVSFVEKEKEKPLFLILNTAINSDILQYIGNIDVDRSYDIRFTYKGRFTVYIGDTDQIEKKIRFMLLLTEEKLGPTAKGKIYVDDATTARFLSE